jgi:hypothetical protein
MLAVRAGIAVTNSGRMRCRAGSAGRAPSQQESVMKLSPVLTKRTLSQFDAQAIPDDNPAMPQLNRLFGDHTFFIGDSGLHIVEPAEKTQAGEPVGSIVKVASWSNDDHTSLTPHDPEITATKVPLGDPEPER